MPEGTPFFPENRLIRVTAPIAEAQVDGNNPAIDRPFPNAHRQQSGASDHGGWQNSCNRVRLSADAWRRSGDPGPACFFHRRLRRHFQFLCGVSVRVYQPFGTQAHSYIMAHLDEAEAFRNFLEVFPESTLLIDTYSVRAAIDKVIALGRKPGGVRLDSGNVLADSIWIRSRLDAADWNDVKICASGDLDEYRVDALIHNGARIDAFGVGTALSTSADAPFVGVIYKLVEVETGGIARGTAKFSEDKKTYPGRKQVFRFMGKDGEIERRCNRAAGRQNFRCGAFACSGDARRQTAERLAML